MQFHEFRRFEAEVPTKPLASEADLRRRFPWTLHIKGLAFAAELESCIACIGPHVAEQPFDGGKIVVRGKSDRFSPRGGIMQQFAGIARIDGCHRSRIVQPRDHHFEGFRVDGPEIGVLDAKAPRIEQEQA